MKRKYVSVIALLALSVGLSGCIIPTIPDLTEEQEQVITEYAAGLLLKYDSKGSKGLLSEEELAEAEKEEALRKEKEERNKQLADEYIKKTEEARKQKEAEKADKKSKKDSDKQQEVAVPQDFEIASDDMGGFLALDGLKVSLEGYGSVESYMGDDNSSLFSVDAAEGNKLIVAYVSVANNSSDDVYVDMFGKDYKYRLDMDGSEVAYSSNTLFLNDLSMYKDTIAAGTSIDTVLLFEVNENVDVDKVELTLINGKDTGKVRFR